MPATLFGGNSGVSTLGNNDFYPPAGSVGVNETTESRIASPLHTPGTISNLAFNTTTAGANGLWRLRKNSVNANCAVQVVPNAAQYNDGTIDHFADGDTMDFQLVSSTTVPVAIFWKGVFTADSGHVSLISTSGAGSTLGVRFMAIGGTSGNTPQSATESDMQATMRTSGVLQRIAVGVNTNTNTSTTTIRSRKNTANGNIVCNVSGSSTGVFQEGVLHTDSFTSGDLLDWTVNQLTVGQFKCNIKAELSYNASSAEAISGFWTSIDTSGAGASVFYPVIGGELAGGLTESLRQLYTGFPTVATNLRMPIVASNTTGVCTFKLRVNGADGNQILTLPAGATGLFEDTTHSDNIGATDLINYVLINDTDGLGFNAGMTIMTFNPSYAPLGAICQ